MESKIKKIKIAEETRKFNIEWTVHFRSLSERVQNSSVNYEKYAKLCEDLLEEFTIRFSN